MLIGGLLTVIVLAAVVWLSVKTADGPEPGSVPDGQVRWGTLNSGEVEDSVRSELALESAGDPSLRELARHHAFSMASRGVAGEMTPEGEDHAARRARLTPLFVGTTREVSVLFSRPSGAREETVGAQGAALLREAGLVFGPGEGAGVGAAVEAGICGVVAVVGKRLATLHAPPVLGVAGGRWTLSGDTAGGEALTAQVRVDGGAWSHAGQTEPKERLLGEPVPGRFLLELDLPTGPGTLDVRVLSGTEEVLLVPVRNA